MAMTATVGATKYGMQLTFRNANTQSDSTKSYNGLNFSAETATDRAGGLKGFLYGSASNDGHGLVAVIQAMNSGYSIMGTALTASNPVTFASA